MVLWSLGHDASYARIVFCMSVVEKVGFNGGGDGVNELPIPRHKVRMRTEIDQ